MRKSARAALLLLLFGLAALPVSAARPLLDSGKWDNYFALFARDAAVPWKRVSLRLDTYSGAAVDFAAFDVDPTDVLVAGANARPRPIDTAHRTASARWRFTPPPGLTFASNDVDIPLGNREGFFVIEARRGDAVQQVWLNLSRVGLLTKESPGGSFVYGTDLGTGRALAHMRMTYLIGTSFAYAATDPHGLSRVPHRARFVLAEWGRSKAFASILPQSPLPSAIVAVRADRGSVRAGDVVHVIGFARRRSGNAYKPSSGIVEIAILARGRPLTSVRAELDRSGAFASDLALGANVTAGDVAILASIAGASGGATIHVDGVGDTALALSASCTNACPSDSAIPLTIAARRGAAIAENAAVRVRIVRTPHVIPPDRVDEGAAWGTTTVMDATVRTDGSGNAHVNIPAPTDGLASTYGIIVGSGSSTASASLVAPTARIALSVRPKSDAIDVSDPASIDVRGFDALDGSPASGAIVHVRIAHGPSAQDQTLTLDAAGRAHVTFRDLALGMNLVSADASVNGRTALDVASVTVAPRALGGASGANAGDVHVTLDRLRYAPNERVAVSATLSGASGDAVITMESSRGITTVVTPSAGGSASATLALPETIGASAIGVAFVRDGAIVATSVPLVIDAPGHQRALALSSDRATYAPGTSAKITIADAGDRGAATLAVRVSDRRGANGASFEDVAGILAAAATTTQNRASADPAWHTWVAPARSRAGDVFGFERPRQIAAVDTPTTASARVLSWSIDRSNRDTLEVVVPKEAGRYVLGIVKIAEDGDVGAASVALTVQ